MKDFIQKEINDHDRQIVKWLKERDWTWYGCQLKYTSSDCQTEEGYNIVHGILVDWHHKEEAYARML